MHGNVLDDSLEQKNGNRKIDVVMALATRYHKDKKFTRERKRKTVK